MAKATQENEKLRAQNKELNADIVQIQGLVGDFAKQQQNNDSIIAQFRLSVFLPLIGFFEAYSRH